MFVKSPCLLSYALGKVYLLVRGICEEENLLGGWGLPHLCAPGLSGSQWLRESGYNTHRVVGMPQVQLLASTTCRLSLALALTIRDQFSLQAYQ